MAKVKGKKPAPKAKKPAARKAKPAAKPAKKKTASKPAKKPAKKPSKKVTAKPAPKKTTPPAKTAKPAPKPAASKVKTAAKTVARVAVAAVAGAAAGAMAGRAAGAAADEGKRKRRSRPRVTSSGPPTAAWFSQGEKPRPSSFIPAPPRAEAPSLVAAPPASSDRLVGSHELTEFAVRTVPVRVDVEAGAGRILLSILPLEVELRVTEGIEWDFRYIGGADVVIDEIIIEFDKPSPFGSGTFRSRRPGAARPHRQLSGAAQKAAAGKRVQYTIRAMNAFKTEMAAARPWVSVTI
jgi:hypothetical protein